MRFQYLVLLMILIFVTSSVTIADAQHGQQMRRSRVPADKIEEARALTSPLPQSPDIVAKGKAIYEGKGTCVNCHGKTGHGDGPGATNLNPPPRVFRSHGFWRHRTEGEIFWVIKHGVQGTAMIPFGGLLSDEEIWSVMQYERSFAGGHRGGRGQHGGMAEQKRKGRHGKEKAHDGKGSKHHKSSTEELRQKGQMAAAATVNIEQAITTANQRISGTVIEAEFEEEDGKGLWEVEIVTKDGKIMEVKVDSESGDVISEEEKKAEKKQKRKRKRKGRKGGHGEDHKCCSKERHEKGHDEH